MKLSHKVIIVTSVVFLVALMGFSPLTGGILATLSGRSELASAPLVTIPGSVLPITSGATTVGAASPSTLVHFDVILPLINSASIDSIIKSMYTPGSPNYRNFLTPAQFHDLYSPSTADYNALVAYFQSMNLAITYTSDNRLMIGVQGTAADVSNALHTQLTVYQKGGQTYYANSLPVQLPATISVAAVFGMTNASLFQPAYIKGPSVDSASLGTTLSPSYLGSTNGEYLPQQVQAAYNLTTLYGYGALGNGTKIGIVDAFDAPNLISDFNRFNTFFGLPKATVNMIYPTGVPLPGSGPLTGWDVETSLDVQYSHAMAPNATINVFLSNDNADSLNEAVNYAIDSGTVNVISQSFSAPEPLMTPEILYAFHQMYQQAAMEGISVFASTGDWSADNQLGFANVGYPASDPYVTAVGGTSAYFLPVTGISNSAPFSTGGGRINETAWSTNMWNNWGTGGGQSMFFTSPSYQSGTVGAQGTVNRTIPDIAAIADPNTGVIIFYTYGTTHYIYDIGGTSVGSPLWAGIAGVADSITMNNKAAPWGFLNPLLYSLGASPSTYHAFYDVVDGNNGVGALYGPGARGPFIVNGFNATGGYDLVTGWGTPNSYWYSPAPSIQVTPPFVATSSLPTVVTVTGQSFSTGTVTISSSPSLFTPFTVSVSSPPGTFSTTFNVPGGTASGTYAITATEGGSVSTTLVVGPSLQLSPYSAHERSTVTVTGTGFAASSAINLVGDFTPALYFTATSNSTGGFTTTFTVPAVPTYTIDIIANDTMGNTARALLYVTPALTLSVASGVAGAPLQLDGWSFDAYDGVSVTFGPTAIGTFDTDGNGDFSANFNVPDLAPGVYTISGTDSLGNVATTTFSVTSAGVVASAQGPTYLFLGTSPNSAQAFTTNSSAGTVSKLSVYLSGSGTAKISLGSSLFGTELYTTTVSVSGDGWYNVTVPGAALSPSTSYYLSVSQLSGSVTWGVTNAWTYMLNVGSMYFYAGTTVATTTSFSFIFTVS